jgi:hypothetical protein
LAGITAGDVDADHLGGTDRLRPVDPGNGRAQDLGGGPDVAGSGPSGWPNSASTASICSSDESDGVPTLIHMTVLLLPAECVLADIKESPKSIIEATELIDSHIVIIDVRPERLR